MRLPLERSVAEAGAVTCVTEPGRVNTPLTLSSCTSAAFELMFIAKIFSAMSLATASGSPTAVPPNGVGRTIHYYCCHKHMQHVGLQTTAWWIFSGVRAMVV